MNNRPTLERYRGKQTRHTCPQCGKDHEFSRYIYPETGECVSPEVGRCNREESCGYHYKPRQYFEDNNIVMKLNQKPSQPPQRQQKKTSYIDSELIEKTMRGYETNRFARFLELYFNHEKIYSVLKLYHVGTSNHWPGATVFPQIDTQGRVRTAKIMQYNPDTGKRVKEPHNRINWLHSVLKLDKFELAQCPFGAHLIPDAGTVCIVESEKTCIIAALTWPHYVWISTGGKNGASINPDNFKGKKVILFPDLGVDWSDRAQKVGGHVSQVLQNYASDNDFKEGYDLADFILRDAPQTPPQVESEKTPQTPSQVETKKTPQTPSQVETKKTPQTPSQAEALMPQSWSVDIADKSERFLQRYFDKPPPNWINEISDIENYFANMELPTQPVQLNGSSTITDCSRFVVSHLAAVKRNNGNETFRPYLDRLNELSIMMIMGEVI